MVCQVLTLLRIHLLGKHNHVLGIEKKETLPIGSWSGHSSRISVFLTESVAKTPSTEVKKKKLY